MNKRKPNVKDFLDGPITDDEKAAALSAFVDGLVINNRWRAYHQAVDYYNYVNGGH